jgi:molybdopterin/thiamine biosynthesis adenylyltransferase
MQRYLQQIIVPEIGAAGQKKIAAAKVLIAGAGGTSTSISTHINITKLRKRNSLDF